MKSIAITNMRTKLVHVSKSMISETNSFNGKNQDKTKRDKAVSLSLFYLDQKDFIQHQFCQFFSVCISIVIFFINISFLDNILYKNIYHEDLIYSSYLAIISAGSPSSLIRPSCNHITLSHSSTIVLVL